MPYVPSKKTDGKSTDRETIETVVENLAREVAPLVNDNVSLVETYKSSFSKITRELADLVSSTEKISSETILANTILEIASTYGYGGAFLGELNYAITRFIQRVPQIKVQNGTWKETDELRYWLYACTIEALTWTAHETLKWGMGIGGVFEDIKDEYKRRVNTAYEAAQILKSGDCYDTPYYTRLVEVVEENGTLIGHMEVMLKRSEKTLRIDKLDLRLVLRERPEGGKKF